MSRYFFTNKYTDNFRDCEILYPTVMRVGSKAPIGYHVVGDSEMIIFAQQITFYLTFALCSLTLW